MSTVNPLCCAVVVMVLLLTAPPLSAEYAFTDTFDATSFDPAWRASTYHRRPFDPGDPDSSGYRADWKLGSHPDFAMSRFAKTDTNVGSSWTNTSVVGGTILFRAQGGVTAAANYEVTATLSFGDNDRSTLR